MRTPMWRKGTMRPEKIHSLLPLLAQCRSGSVFFFFFPYTLSKRAYMEGRRKKASHSCTGPRVERGKCIFSGCIVRFLHKMVHGFFCNFLSPPPPGMQFVNISGKKSWVIFYCMMNYLAKKLLLIIHLV